MTTQEFIKTTTQLVAIRSTADNPAGLREALEFVADMIRRACPDITVEYFGDELPSFLAYKGKKRPATFDILLNAHVDVVPASAKDFKAYEKQGRLYGRGALDMKGTAVALTDVFCEMVNQVPYVLGFQVVTDEETSGYYGARLQIEQGVRAKFVVIGEYANHRNTIYNAARGLCWAEIGFTGKSAHGGHLWHGTNAVIKAGDFAGAVLRRYPTPDKETWTTTASIASLQTPNETFNKVPDSATLKIDFRFTQEDPVFRDETSLRAFIESIDPEARLLRAMPFESAVFVEELNPYVQGLAAAMHSATGATAKYLGRPAGSDGRHFAMVNCDIVEFGLYGKHSHSDNEYMELASFPKYQATMREFLKNPIPATLKTANAKPPADSAILHEELLRELVTMPTITKDSAACAHGLEFVADFLAERGMYIEHFERNGRHSLVATTRPAAKDSKVLLQAHIDVVPGADEQFTLKLQNDNFVGRGVMDMKHAIAAYLTLVDRLKDELQNYDFGIMITSDEEVGGHDGVEPLVNELGYRPKVVVVPDGGNNWELETFQKGVAWVKLTAAGKTAHAARPWEGESAIKRLLGAVHDIQALAPADPKPTDTFLSVGTIEGGTTANQIPSAATAMIDVRSGSATEHEQVMATMQRICQEHGVTTEVVANSPPCVTDPKHPLVAAFTDLVAQVTGTTHSTSYSLGSGDARFFNAAGIPTVIINPTCGAIHTDDEWISRASFTQFCTVLELYIQQQAATQQPSRKQNIAQLSKQLLANDKTHVWCVTYGSGLVYDNFVSQVTGIQNKGWGHTYKGCTDKTLPLKNTFLSLPYAMYFAGNCKHCNGGGGRINIQPEPSHSAHTLARAYLITTEQFAEIAAEQGEHADMPAIPYKQALKNGHATIKGGSGHYNELVFCGVKDGIPMFTLTAARPEAPYTPPSASYARILCKGLSENAALGDQAAVDYMLAAPGIAGNYKKKDLAKIYSEATLQR